MVQWLQRCRFACGCSGFKSCSNLWFGFVSSCPGFNSTVLCKQPTGCLLSVGVVSYVSVLSLNCFFQITKSGVPVN